MNKIFLAIIALVVLVVIVIVGYYMMKPADSINQNLTQNQMNNTQNNTSSTPDKFTIQGMNVEITKRGSGTETKFGDMVTVNYTGKLTNGTIFDSSLNTGREPFQFVLGQGLVIKGWDLGVVGMQVGEKRTLTIPPELGYGANGYPPAIPPSATLIFDVELLKIN